MDLIDKKILSLLQSDATAPITQIASKVGLSSTPCWRRIQKLEKEGIIRARVALLNAEKLNAELLFLYPSKLTNTMPLGSKRFRER